MGMTIEEARYLIVEEAKYLIEHHKPNDVNNVYELGEAFCVAIDIMRKYQAIKEYVSVPTRYGTMAEDCQKLDYVRKVIEDGNDD